MSYCECGRHALSFASRRRYKYANKPTRAIYRKGHDLCFGCSLQLRQRVQATVLPQMVVEDAFYVGIR